MESKKGRSKELIKKRNIKLCVRFYYFDSLIGLKFSKSIELLSFEFDLSHNRIEDLLAENSEMISIITYNKPSPTKLQGYYPWLNWRYKGIEQGKLFDLSQFLVN